MSSTTSGISDFLSQNAMDIKNRYDSTDKRTDGVSSTDYASLKDAQKVREREPSNELTFEDMLGLMITQLQNQTIDNTADTNDMMNQLISMTVMQSLTTLTTAVEEVQMASVMNYSASLVGKDVTLGVYDKEGNIKELYGTVEASGTYDGKQVIFVNGQSYFLSSIMGVGRLPEKKEDDDKLNIGGIVGSVTDKTEGAEGAETENKDVENSGAAGSTGSTGTENNNTGNGTEASGVSGAAEAAQV